MTPSNKWALLVAYGYNEDTQRRWHRFLKQAGIACQNALVLDNQPPQFEGVIAGSNLQFEFSGYQEVLNHFLSAQKEATEIYILNDTLFSHHWAFGWARMLRTMSLSPGIFGDTREEPVSLEDRPLRILASWNFALVGPNAIQAFLRELKSALHDFTQPIEGEDYKRYQEHYLSPRLMGGYTKVLDSKELLNKRRCIWAEHRLSRQLEETIGFSAYPSLGYPLVHLIDRMLAAKRRIYHLLKE